MSVAHSVRTEVSQKRDIWKDKEENRRNHPKIVRTKRCRNYRNRSVQRPYTPFGINTTISRYSTIYDVSQGEKYADDFRPTCKSKVQV